MCESDPDIGVWSSYPECACSCQGNTTWFDDEGCICDPQVYGEAKWRCSWPGHEGVVGTWNNKTCHCDCPTGWSVDGPYSTGSCEEVCDHTGSHSDGHFCILNSGRSRDDFYEDHDCGSGGPGGGYDTGCGDDFDWDYGFDPDQWDPGDYYEDDYWDDGYDGPDWDW